MIEFNIRPDFDREWRFIKIAGLFGGGIAMLILVCLALG